MDGQNNRGHKWEGNHGQGNSDCGRAIDGHHTRNTHHRDIPGPNYQDPGHYRPPPMGYQTPYPQKPPQYLQYPPQPQYPTQPPLVKSQQVNNVCQLCQNQGHYDYQCQFVGEFMA